MTSPKRLPRGRGRASLADLAAWAPTDFPPRGGDAQGGDVGAGAGVNDAPTGGDAKKIQTRRKRL